MFYAAYCGVLSTGVCNDWGDV